ncbi:AP-5 complex subunit beta-1-like isoform X2 [Bacillus rossius redtenbacheri]|uniref:AP-5 complex subunit beta-1-like isoform X2 n=1 Tax=Bacillus rossius redtenbacheri TaxID=93214 RepID=UPI002FDCAC4F
MKFLADVAKQVANGEDWRDLSWTVGHHLLCLCNHFLRQSESSEIHDELCSLLEACIAACGDVDVQDRARMYLSLLHTLSGKKLKEILCVPGAGLASLMSDEAELRMASLAKHLREPILALAKQCREPPPAESCGGDDAGQPTWPEDILKAHYDLLSHLKKEAVDIKCIVRRTKDSSADIQALVLYFNVPENWGTVEDAMVGHLSKEGDGDTEFKICCHPRKPFPVKMDVSAEFSVENVFHTCPVHPLDVQLNDFFQPLPVPVDYASCRSRWYLAVFEKLWESLAEEGYAAPYVDRDPGKVLRKVGDYIIRSSSGEDPDMWAMIFLPPENHLLMKIKLDEDSVFVKIRTDIVLLLAYFNEFLKR